MKVLFVMEHPGVGSLVPALELMHRHGHELHLRYEAVKSVESERELRALEDVCPGVVFGELPSPGRSGRVELAAELRRGIDYLRYLDPQYPDGTQLRIRAASKAPATIVRLGDAALRLGPGAARLLLEVLRRLERCLAPPASIVRFLAEERPDVLLLGHLLPLGSAHADYLRAAKRLGIRSVFPVRGWDNLTNKGLIRDVPDLVLVWNEVQAHEAEHFHRIPPEHVRLTGAPSVDHWFGWQPSRSREEFCGEVGLRADRPIVLYACSSGFVARHEVGFVRDWIERLRARGGVFAEAGFLVRPHPLNAAQWAGAGLDGEQVRVWPRFGEAPHDDDSRRNFFDSFFHAAAVVGINTTAQIESAIIGRPVHTLLAEEFRNTQQGTLHFHHLKAEEDPLLYVGETFEQHAEQLEESLLGRPDDGRSERFLRRFIRPHGLDRSATELVVEAVEELAALPPPAPARGPLVAPVVRLALSPLAALAWRRAARRRAREEAGATPADELRRTVRKRAMNRSGTPVVAGPWLGDELGELLYWIPVLRWAQATAPGLRERLFVVGRASSRAWYAGVGAGAIELEALVDAAEPGAAGPALGEEALQGPLRERVLRAFGLGSRAFNVLAPEPVVAARSELAEQTRATRPGRRLLEFAPLTAPELPAGTELPSDFLAVRFEASDEGAEAALGERAAVVSLDAYDRPGQAAVLARARGFVGGFGVEAVVASLLGVPAVALVGAQSESDRRDLRLAESFLGAEPFGGLAAVESGGDPGTAVERALLLLDRPVEAVAGV